MSARLNASFAEIAAVLRAQQSFLVLSHHRPDGDAYGSQLALALCLQALGKDVTVWNEDGLLEKFTFLPQAKLIHAPDESKPKPDFDCLVAVDCANFVRLGRPLRFLGDVKLTLNLDHHISNERFGNLVHVAADMPATAQLLYELFVAENLPFTKEMAECLFVALSTDTGCFQYRGTTARTFEIVADLVRRGVDVAALSQACYDRQPLRRVRLLGRVFDDLRLTAGDRIATATVSLALTAELGLQDGDTEDVINHLRSIDTVEVAAFFEEMRSTGGKPGARVSLRSKREDIDVSAICARFGGGGHRLAAGARITGALEEIRNQVTQAIHDSLPLPGRR